MTTETAADRRERIGSLSSAPSRDIPFPEVDPHQAAEQEEILQRLMEKETLEALEKAGKYSRATWKIQLWIKSDRSVHKPLTFTLSVWESGKRLHGGGDESAFFCRRNPAAPAPKAPPFGAMRSVFKATASPDGCDGVIPGGSASGGIIVCPHCGVRWDTEAIADSLFYRVPVEVAAEIVAKRFRQLGNDCDIFVKFRPEDVRVKMMAASYGLHEAIKLKGLVIYPLARILVDTSNGATLESRFKALLLG